MLYSLIKLYVQEGKHDAVVCYNNNNISHVKLYEGIV